MRLFPICVVTRRCVEPAMRPPRSSSMPVITDLKPHQPKAERRSQRRNAHCGLPGGEPVLIALSRGRFGPVGQDANNWASGSRAASSSKVIRELCPRRKAPRLGRKVAVALRERVLEAAIRLTLAEVCAGAPVYSGMRRAPVIKFPNVFCSVEAHRAHQWRCKPCYSSNLNRMSVII